MHQNVNVPSGGKTYGQRTPEDYIQSMNPDIRDQLNGMQLDEVRRLLGDAIPKPSPKIVDLRFTVDLLISRFYIVLFVGKDKRRKTRKHSIMDPFTYVGNLVTVIVLLIGLNLIVSAALVLGVYLLKSALGVDLVPGHSPELLKRFLK
jgi:hypothetical protein